MRKRGPVVVGLVYAIPVWLWVAAAPLGTRFFDQASTLTSGAVLSALVGVTAFAVNIVLGARLKIVDELFGGLDKMYRFHKLNGIFAFALLLAHGVLILAARASQSLDSAIVTLTPGAGATVFVGVLALAAMAATILVTLYARLGHEVFVYVQRFFGIVFLAAAFHVFTTPGLKASSPVLTLYLAALFVIGVGAWIYRSVFDNLLVKRHDYGVTRVNHLDESVVEITMTPRAKRLRFVPGQFVFVTFYSNEFAAQFHPVSLASEGQFAVITLRPGDVGDQFHPFSITSGKDERTLRVTVKAVGDFTTALQQLEPGAAARVEGPYGGFSYLNASNPRQVWIAGGIGVTPFLSMARSLGGSKVRVDMFYGVKSRSQAYFLDELNAISEAGDALTLTTVAEDEEGFVDVEGIEAAVGGLADKDFFLCGPPAMLDALVEQLVAKGVPRRQIHFERFGFVKAAAPATA